MRDICVVYECNTWINTRPYNSPALHSVYIPSPLGAACAPTNLQRTLNYNNYTSNNLAHINQKAPRICASTNILSLDIWYIFTVQFLYLLLSSWGTPNAMLRLPACVHVFVCVYTPTIYLCSFMNSCFVRDWLIKYNATLSCVF